MTDAGHVALELEERLADVADVVARSSDVLRDALGVRFTPLAPATYRAAWRSLPRAVGGPGAALYVHVPFCARVCTYCLLSSARAQGRDAIDRYVAALALEAERIAPDVDGLVFDSVYVGGGTPTLLSESQIGVVLGAIDRFALSPRAQRGFEAHPSSASEARLACFAEHGFGRVSFGVESFTPAVLAAVDRGDQTTSRVREAVARARRLGLRVNLDLLAGLPGETVDSFEASVREALALEPDSMSVNRFLAEGSPLARFGYGHDEAENARVDAMLLRADDVIHAQRPSRSPGRRMPRAGYGTQYLWDPRPDARPYFQQDMIGPASTLTLGHGALGHAHAVAYTVAAGSVDDYVAALEAGDDPPRLASPTPLRFEMAFLVADLATRGELSAARFAATFGVPLMRALGREVLFLVGRGFLVRSGDRIAKPPRSDFSVVHLMAFLAGGASAPPTAACAPDTDSSVRVSADDDFVAILRAAALGSAPSVRLDFGDGLSADAATRLAAASESTKVAVELVDADRGARAQYAMLREELPPSVLWCRIAMRAAREGRARVRPLGQAAGFERT